MPVLAFATSPPPASSELPKYREGDTLIEVGAHARDWVLQLASLRDGRLADDDVPALQSLLDSGDPELAVLIAAIGRHGTVWIRRR